MTDSTEPSSLYRILDANFNRCQEGLRVLEEIARFGNDHPTLGAAFKSLRHRLVHCFPEDWLPKFQAMRNVQGDVGRSVQAPDEYQREDLRSLFAANASRIKQSLRALEEFSKPLSPAVAMELEAVRYEFYRCESLASLAQVAMRRLGEAQIYVLTEGFGSDQQFESWIRRLLESPPDVIQLRDKKLGDRDLLQRSLVLRRLTRESGTLMVINDRPDIARLCDADGVHVGQEELTVDAVRRIVGPEMLIGVSTHAERQARNAVLDGAQYLGAGPTFVSQTKSFQDFPGLAYLREVASSTEVPVFAIGGIDLDNVEQVLQTGIRRIAVSGCVARAECPSDVISRFREKLARHASSRGATS
jgi:thiamine-phosphate pyrophosphorylase